MAAVSSPTAENDRSDAQFIADSQAAMRRMMTAMDVKPTGNADADFAAMMVPHHMGAIEMAQAELRAGRTEQLRRLAQEIIVTQQQEISVMRLALTRSTQPTSPVDDVTNTASVGNPVSHRDRVYAAEQFSNTVSVTDPVANRLLGVIRLGRSCSRKPEPALSRSVAGARDGLLAGPPDARGGLDWLQLGDVHRYGDQRGEARRIRRSLT